MVAKAQRPSTLTLKDHLILHGKWRSRATRAIHDLRGWLRALDKASAANDERLRRALSALAPQGHQVVVAGAAQRGKTELINALFFGEYGHRLLPTAAGDSCCPVEIRWDSAEGDACLRLLPIESRRQGHDLSALKADLGSWVRLPLHPQEPEQVRATLAEIHQTKPVLQTQARHLGLAALAAEGDARAHCDIPCWRYAILNFPHPLLKKGMVIHDLPGLATMDRDSSLYQQLLQQADSIVFTLAADRGVEATDLALWQRYLRPHATHREQVIAAITRGDLFARDDPNRDTLLERLRRHAANALGLDVEAVLAVSGRDGLTAKIADRPARLHSSGVDALESLLGARLTSQHRQGCRAAVEANAGELIRDGLAELAARVDRTEHSIRELRALEARSEGLASRLLDQARQDERGYLKSVRTLELAQQALDERAAHCLHLLDPRAFDRLARAAREHIDQSWSSRGIQRAMAALFDELRYKVAQTGPDAARLRRQLDATYSLLRQDAGLAAEPPRVFTPGVYRNEMDLLHAEAARAMTDGEFLLSSRRTAIERFERRFLERARVLFENLHQDWADWTRAALAPALAEIEGRKAAAERRLMQYQQFKYSREDARAEHSELERERVRLAKQLTLLRNIRNSLDYEPSAEPDPTSGPPGPYLITDGGERVRRSG